MENLINIISEQMRLLIRKVGEGTATKDDKVNLAVLTSCLKNIKY